MPLYNSQTRMNKFLTVSSKLYPPHFMVSQFSNPVIDNHVDPRFTVCDRKSSSFFRTVLNGQGTITEISQRPRSRSQQSSFEA